MLIGWAAAISLLSMAYCFLVQLLMLWAGEGQVGWEVIAACRQELLAPLFDLLLLLTGLAGATRALCYYPRLRPQYVQWLMAGPWTPAKPLPLGPIHLVWQDAAALMLLAITGWIYLHGNALLVIAAFFVGYAVASCCILFAARDELYLSIQVLLLGALIRWGHISGLFVALSVPMMVCATAGLRRSLNGFPWGMDQLPGTEPQALPMYTSEGFLSPIRPQPARYAVTYSRTVLIGLLLAWLAYAVAACPAVNDRITPYSTILSMVCVSSGLIRYIIYRAAKHPPISLFGRLMTLRPIISGYSALLLSPLVCVIIGIIGAGLCEYTHLEQPLVCAFTACALAWALFAIGPRYRDWCLTSKGHVVIYRTPQNTVT